jgi:Helicase conserved C-terminal domain/SNF2-related domain/Cornifin (SPRR) family
MVKDADRDTFVAARYVFHTEHLTSSRSVVELTHVYVVMQPALLIPIAFKKSFHAFYGDLTGTQQVAFKVQFSRDVQVPVWQSHLPHVGGRPLPYFDASQPDKPGVWKRIFLHSYRITLFNHQEATAQHFATLDWKQKLVFTFNWGMGSGKTQGAVTALSVGAHPVSDVMVICPKSMVSEWLHALQQWEPHRLTSSEFQQCFTLMTKDQVQDPKLMTFLQHIPTVIVDEFHYLKNANQATHTLLMQLREAKHLLLLSGTIVPNGPSDVRGLLTLYGEPLETSLNVDGEEAEQRYFTPERVFQTLQNRISVFHPHIHAKDDHVEYFPRVSTKVITIPVDMGFWCYYMTHMGCMDFPIQEDVNGKCISIRLPGGSHCGSKVLQSLSYHYYDGSEETGVHPKFRMLREMWPTLSLPVVIYSDYVDGVVDTLVSFLVDAGLVSSSRLCMITGDTDSQTRAQGIKTFNSGGSIDVLFISKVFGVGVTLKGARTFVVMDPGDNLETEAQAIARVIRMKSHSHLPIEQQEVHVIRLILSCPTSVKNETWTPEECEVVHRMWCETQDTDKCVIQRMVRKSQDKNRWLEQAKQDPTFMLRVLRRHWLLHKNGLMEEEIRWEQNQEKQKSIEPFTAALLRASIRVPEGTMKAHHTVRANQKLAKTYGVHVDPFGVLRVDQTQLSQQMKEARSRWLDKLCVPNGRPKVPGVWNRVRTERVLDEKHPRVWGMSPVEARKLLLSIPECFDTPLLETAPKAQKTKVPKPQKPKVPTTKTPKVPKVKVPKPQKPKVPKPKEVKVPKPKEVKVPKPQKPKVPKPQKPKVPKPQKPKENSGGYDAASPHHVDMVVIHPAPVNSGSGAAAPRIELAVTSRIHSIEVPHVPTQNELDTWWKSVKVRYPELDEMEWLQPEKPIVLVTRQGCPHCQRLLKDDIIRRYDASGLIQHVVWNQLSKKENTALQTFQKLQFFTVPMAWIYGRDNMVVDSTVIPPEVKKGW